jgi:hypothetical protein
MKLGVYIMAPEPVITAYYINASHHSLCLYVDLHIIARQWPGKTVIVALVMHAAKEELFEAFSVWSIS